MKKRENVLDWPTAENDNAMDTVLLLQECAAVCTQQFAACAPKESGMNLPYLHLKRLQACMEICESTARLLLKDGLHTERLCEICARICEQTAHSCDQIDHRGMQFCADLCRQTARGCLEQSHRIRMAEAA